MRVRFPCLPLNFERFDVNKVVISVTLKSYILETEISEWNTKALHEYKAKQCYITTVNGKTFAVLEFDNLDRDIIPLLEKMNSDNFVEKAEIMPERYLF